MTTLQNMAKQYGVKLIIMLTLGLLIFQYVQSEKKERGKLEIISVNAHLDSMSASLRKAAFPDTEEKTKVDKVGTVIALEFQGDSSASRSKYLASEITTILSIDAPIQEVVISIESGGGEVHQYGFAASQLQRLTDHGVNLTACVDKIAASGGYMMASTADKIIAAPFAVVGSIGVVAEIPNFNKLLKKHGIEFEVLTSGENKRTMTILGENTDRGREAFKNDLVDVHTMFKDFISGNRSGVDINKVSNGDIWYGQEAIANGLVDEISTCDQYLMNKAEVANVYKFQRKGVSTISQTMSASISSGISNGIKEAIKSLIHMKDPLY